MELNKYGREYFKYAQQILQMFREGKEKLHEEFVKQEFKMGANEMSSQYLLPKVMHHWKHDDTLSSCHIATAPNDVLKVQLLNEQIDVAIMGHVESDRIQQRRIFQNKLELVVSAAHPLAKRNAVSLHDLQNEPFVLIDNGSLDWELIMKLFEAAHIRPHIKYQVDHIEMAKSIIHSNLAIGFLPEIAVQCELLQNKLKKVPIESFPTLSQELYLSTIIGKASNPFYETVASSLLHVTTL